MKTHSFIKQNQALVPVEVEVILMPGLSQIQFLGLADQAIKESTDRIKSALRNQGYEFPAHQKVIVNLRPNTVKKTSEGIDLAVAALILWETGQAALPYDIESTYLYGELNLQGEVFEPRDFDFIPDLAPNSKVITGKCPNHSIHNIHSKYVICEIKNIEAPTYTKSQFLGTQEKPTSALTMSFSESQALLFKLVALGDHHILLAGSSGSGKSTWGENLICFLSELSREEFKSIYLQSRKSGVDVKFRPLVRPHHTTPTMAMIGGGNWGYSGEISRAHKGVLIMDEFLEFNEKVIEALREPMEQGEMRVTRSGKTQIYKNECIVVGTTNLCPCGDYIPGLKKNCRFTLKKCESYSQKFSGPVMDRFHMIEFTNPWSQEKLCYGKEIHQDIEDIRKWQTENSIQSSSKTNIESIYMRMDEFTRNELIPTLGGSKRRLHATLRVAATLANIDKSLKIKNMHINKAMKWTFTNFQKLKRWD